MINANIETLKIYLSAHCNLMVLNSLDCVNFTHHLIDWIEFNIVSRALARICDECM